MNPRKKLIEVALPLAAINAESAREKSIRHGHPSTVHLWWARRPLASCRAVLFASLVDDPDSDPMFAGDEDLAAGKRAELFKLIEDLVKWENSNNAAVINKARAEIARCVATHKICEGVFDKDDELFSSSGSVSEIRQMRATPQQVDAFLEEHGPAVLDPFSGGGSIPLEAQRLGLRARGSDLNPVAVLVAKALVEIPSAVACQPPVNPESRGSERFRQRKWLGVEGLAADVRYYGSWLRNQAEGMIGHRYPKIRVTEAMAKNRPEIEPHVGQELTVIAWLWARTVTCSNPACGREMPLLRSLCISKKRKKREVWLQPSTDDSPAGCRFHLTDSNRFGLDGTIKGRAARCIYCSTVIPLDHIRREAQAGRLGKTMTAIVADSPSGRIYLPAVQEHQQIACDVVPTWKPEQQVTTPCHDVDRLPMYGMSAWGDAFTNRQLSTLVTLCDLVKTAKDKIEQDMTRAGIATGNVDRARAITTFLALAVSRTANTHCTLGVWSTSRDQSINAFGRQAIGMTWDFPEVNPFAGAAGDPGVSSNSVAKVIDRLPATPPCEIVQASAVDPLLDSSAGIVSTDPPYYDNISYAELSDFFYVWLRRSLSDVYPDLFGTLLTPKAEELIAAPFRHNGSEDKAKQHFERGLREAFDRLRVRSDADYPVTIFYAFKQSEVSGRKGGGQLVASTGWETMLTGLIDAGFSIDRAWPLRTERDQGLKTGTNVLASSIVLVCRQRSPTAKPTSRRQFLNDLKAQLPESLRMLQRGHIAPVDLAQAAIGPGMAIFTQHEKVLESDGSPMTVRTALELINQTLDEVLAEQEGEFDADTRWAIAWFEQHAHDGGPYGEAETLSRAKNVSVQGLEEAGMIEAKGGKVRLLRRDELPEDWDPTTDERMAVWKIIQHLIRILEIQGETAAAALLPSIGAVGEIVRDLAYRLYTTCERRKWSQEALAYNSLVTAWPEITRLAPQRPPSEAQTELF